ncbi:hypothetical protein VNO80_03726 [Phaseolus coccineus]|uniref:Uncharacterized protein n=1 Tax=Phaseolus coccineus TaxID=3886 RepID=A0AAN9RNU4_PHACN
MGFFQISILACFCAIHSHGLQTLLSFSTIVPLTSCPPFGFNILGAFLIRPVCLSSYGPRSSESQGTHGYWTFVDHLRLYGYYHLLDFVLSLILITRTLEYDILHLGYLGFAMGLEITSRSGIVKIIIFVLVALQSYMFAFPEFAYVSWKTAHLRHIRKAEELKHL